MILYSSAPCLIGMGFSYTLCRVAVVKMGEHREPLFRVVHNFRYCRCSLFNVCQTCIYQTWIFSHCFLLLFCSPLFCSFFCCYIKMCARVWHEFDLPTRMWVFVSVVTDADHFYWALTKGTRFLALFISHLIRCALLFQGRNIVDSNERWWW